MNNWLPAPTFLAVATMLLASLSDLRAAETHVAPERVGTYDSRVVAYAHFCSESHQRQLKELVSAAEQAKTSGDNEQFRQLDAKLRAAQDRIHLQVFSTAPITELLEELKELVAKAKQEAGVTQLISKWDEEAVKAKSAAEQRDVTDLLLRGFKLTEKQARVADSLRKQKPLPLDEAQRLVKEGKL